MAQRQFNGFITETFENKPEGMKVFIQHVPAILNKGKDFTMDHNIYSFLVLFLYKILKHFVAESFNDVTKCISIK